jgi:hypothetical protein
MDDSAATIISSTWRGHARRVEYLQLRSSSIKFQSLVRGWLARLAFRRAHAAAIIVRAVRGAVVRRRRLAKLAKLAAAVTLVANRWRAVRATREYARRRAALTRIQAIARGGRVRLVVRRVRRERDAATTIQASVRCWQARAAYLAVRRAIVTIQASVRRHHARNIYQRIRLATINIARMWRGVKVRRQLRLHLGRVAAATKISCSWRRRRAVSSYSRLHAAVVTAQKNARAALVVRVFRRLKSVIIVQSVIRGWRVRRLAGIKEQGSLEDAEQPAERNAPHMKRDSDGAMGLENDQGRDLDGAAGSGLDLMEPDEQCKGQEDLAMDRDGCGAWAGPRGVDKDQDEAHGAQYDSDDSSSSDSDDSDEEGSGGEGTQGMWVQDTRIRWGWDEDGPIRPRARQKERDLRTWVDMGRAGSAWRSSSSSSPSPGRPSSSSSSSPPSSSDSETRSLDHEGDRGLEVPRRRIGGRGSGAGAGASGVSSGAGRRPPSSPTLARGGGSSLSLRPGLFSRPWAEESSSLDDEDKEKESAPRPLKYERVTNWAADSDEEEKGEESGP